MLRVKSLLSEGPVQEMLHEKGAPSWVVAKEQGDDGKVYKSISQGIQNYGGRGIKFNFKSPRDCADWIMANIPPLTKDRISNWIG